MQSLWFCLLRELVQVVSLYRLIVDPLSLDYTDLSTLDAWL